MPESQIYLAKRTLTNDEIKALPTTAIQLVPAPGAGKLIWPISGRVKLNNSAGAYSIVGAPIWQLVYMASPFPIEASAFVNPVPAITLTGIFSAPFPPLSSYNAVEGYLTWGLTGDEDERTNVPLGIGDIYNGVPDYGDGNVANTCDVSVLYAVVDA